VWSAGCSYGAEAYSLAIIFHELPSGALKSPILATDIDTEILQRAREGVFTDADLKNVSGARKRRHFAPVAGGWRVGDHLRPSVEFRRHDLIADAFERGFDLILCRNVVIYFTDEAKAELYRRLWTSLTPGGVLFIGGTEHIIDSRQIGFEPISSFFYRKPAPGAPE
jgi:chemotaxis protein methyltransferase CheR